MTNEIMPIEFFENRVDTKLINISQIIEYVKDELQMNISDSAMYLLNDEIKEKIQKASVRTLANGRKIIQGKDI